MKQTIYRWLSSTNHKNIVTFFHKSVISAGLLLTFMLMPVSTAENAGGRPAYGGLVTAVMKKGHLPEVAQTTSTSTSSNGTSVVQGLTSTTSSNNSASTNNQPSNNVPISIQANQGPNNGSTSVLQQIASKVTPYVTTPHGSYPVSAGTHHIVVAKYCQQSILNTCGDIVDCKYACPTVAYGHPSSSPHTAAKALNEGSTYFQCKNFMNPGIATIPGKVQGFVLWAGPGVRVESNCQNINDIQKTDPDFLQEVKAYAPPNPYYKTKEEN